MHSLTLQIKRETGALGRINAPIHRHGFKIVDQEILTAVDPKGKALKFLLTGSGDLAGLIDELAGFEFVSEVHHEHLSDLDSTTLSRSNSIALTIANAYPDVVGFVRDFSDSLDNDLRSLALADLGEKVGGLLLRKGTLSRRETAGALPELLQEEILETIGPFTIAEAEEHRLRVLACPFCREVCSDAVWCHFMTGLLRSLLRGLLGQPAVQVEETQCKAIGDETCTFEVSL